MMKQWWTVLRVANMAERRLVIARKGKLSTKGIKKNLNRMKHQIEDSYLKLKDLSSTEKRKLNEFKFVQAHRYAFQEKRPQY